MDIRPDDLIAELEGVAMRTSNGSYVKLDDVRRLMEKQAAPEEPSKDDEPPPKNLIEARGQARRFLERENGKAPINPGRALPAAEPQPVSRP